MLTKKLFEVFIKRNIINKKTILRVQYKKRHTYEERLFKYSGYEKTGDNITLLIETREGEQCRCGLLNVVEIDNMLPGYLAEAYEYDINGKRTFSFFEEKKAGKPKKKLMPFEYIFYVLNRKLDFTIEECMDFLQIDEEAVVSWINDLEPTPAYVIEQAALIDRYIEFCKQYNEKIEMDCLNNTTRLTKKYLSLLEKYGFEVNVGVIPDTIVKKLYILKEKY